VETALLLNSLCQNTNLKLEHPEFYKNQAVTVFQVVNLPNDNLPKESGYTVILFHISLIFVAKGIVSYHQSKIT
jgi:hypothetical protein